MSDQTFGATSETIISPTDFEEIDDVNFEKATGVIKRQRIQGFDEFPSAYSGNVNRSNSHKVNKRLGNRKPLLNYIIYCICKKRDREFKIGWRNYINVTYRELWRQ